MGKHPGNISLGVLLAFILLIMSGCSDNNEKTGSSRPPSADQTNAEFEVYADKLSECFSDISEGTQLFFRENKQIPFTSNPQVYKVFIEEGIAACEKWETALKQLSSSENTKTLIKITGEYVKNQKLFYKHLLNYAASGKFADIQLSNKYSRLAAENMKAYNTELINTLKKNNYTYEIKDGYIHFDSKL